MADEKTPAEEIPDPTPLDPFATQTETLCWVELKACGLRKAVTSAWPANYSRRWIGAASRAAWDSCPRTPKQRRKARSAKR